MFNLKNFKFSVRLFIIALEQSAFDIAALLHLEFNQLMQDYKVEEKRTILTELVNAFTKTSPEASGMVQEKAYLIRQFIEHL